MGLHVSGLPLIAGAAPLGQVLGFTGVVPLAVTIGVLAGLVQMLGLLRWVYRGAGLPAPTPTRPSIPRSGGANAAAFRALHQYLGVGVGEHLGYLFTGLWSVAHRRRRHPGRAPYLVAGMAGVVIGAGLIIASAEFLGSNENRGGSLAGAAIPILYVAWSVWLFALGVASVA